MLLTQNAKKQQFKTLESALEIITDSGEVFFFSRLLHYLFIFWINLKLQKKKKRESV